MLLSLGHVTVRSADFERAERFYCDLLGMRVGPRPAIPVPGRWLYIGDEAVVHLLPRRATAAPDGRSDAEGAIDHFALNAEDRLAVEQRLRAAGQAFESRRLADSDIWQIFLRDPDGVRVELCFTSDHGSGAAADRMP
ncbi:MAG: VOC family protein [Proteobacteria bacterium]|nr:VOC family protein [Pseudomonadota bacterium]